MNPRKTWSLYREIVFNCKQTVDDTHITIDGVVAGTTTASCDSLNSKVNQVGEILASDIIGVYGYSTDDIQQLYTHIEPNSWSFQPVDQQMVKRVVNNLPNEKSTSFDGVPVALLKGAVESLAPSLAACFNETLRTTVYPSELLKGRMKLIHKAGSSDFRSFRSLTILLAESKVDEQLLVDQLYGYLESIDFFTGNQFGFLRNSSCESAATQLVDVIKSSYRKKCVSCVFIDLKRAFDTVDPLRLALKMKQLGLDENSVILMSSYLTNRVTATRIDENTSEFVKVKVGVAQGSKLGPLHFVIYINDLLKLGFKGQMIMYADEAVLLYVNDSMSEMQKDMQHDMLLLLEWIHRNVMTINHDKTSYRRLRA